MINPPITLDEAKKHLAITHTVTDDYISEIIPVAVANVENDLDRPFTDIVCIDTVTGFTATPLRHAVKLMLGTLYVFRDGQQVQQIYDNPAYDRLVRPYRRMGV